jgi:hypothetical protein
MAIQAMAMPMTKSEKPALITGASAEKELQKFLPKFSSADQARIRAAPQFLRQLLAGAYELVYDNYDFLVIGHGPSVVLMPAQGVLNPTRSLANVMRPNLPWHRDSRLGVRNRGPKNR